MMGIGIDNEGREFASIKKIDDLVRESIKRILLTRPGERPGHPEFGIGLQRYIFSPMSSLNNETFRDGLINKIQNFDPRVVVESLKFTQTDTNTLTMTLRYRISDEFFEKESDGIETIEIAFRGIQK